MYKVFKAGDRLFFVASGAWLGKPAVLVVLAALVSGARYTESGE